MAIQKITSGILADGAIVAADIANGSITTAKIADGNVTSAKIDTTVSQLFGMRNRIINGDMVIDQRNAGASITPTTTGTYSLDRWICALPQSSKYSVQQSSTAPTGYSNSLLVTSLSAYTVGAAEQFSVSQRIEGYNVSDFNLGTANAVTFTISFWVRSSLTGTFGGSLRNSAQDRSYPFSYTISTANTWEQKTVTLTGDTTGTWIGATNGIGLTITFGIGVGSTLSGTAGAWAGANYPSATGATSVLGTNGATLYITGVQLEIGSTATPFERRLYTNELALCQRYYTTINDFYYRGYIQNTAPGGTTCFLPVKMRASPTITKVGTWTVANCGQPVVGSSSGDASQSFYIVATWTATADGYYTTTTTSHYLTASAEL